MIKKLFLLLIFPILLTGCGSVTKTELSFASWGSVTEVGIIKNIIQDYEKQNPDIKINFMHIPQNYFPKIHLLFASNTAPDIIFINNLNIPIYEKYLEDLSGEVDEKDFYLRAIEGMKYENRLLAIPRDVSLLLFYVNTDKTKLPQSGWTLEDLKKYKFKDAFTVSYEDDIYWLTPYLAYFGGGVLNNNSELIINNSASRKATDFYKNLKKEGLAPSKSQVGSSTLAQMFLNGNIVFYLSGRWMYPKISETAKFNWAVINFPYGIHPQPADVSGWAVSKNSKNKKEAIKFVKYISGEQSAEYFAKTGLIVPARIKAAKILDNDNHNERAFLDITDNSEKRTVNKEYKKITDKINKELDL